MGNNVSLLCSGGVDSAASAHLLHAQGFSVTLYYLKIWLEDELSYLGECPWEEDLFFVQQTGKILGIPVEVVMMQREYFDTVIAYTIDQLKKGNTPNPDVFCNKWIKYGEFFLKYVKDDASVATGHYAQWEGDHLIMAVDRRKDQTYFLAYTQLEYLRRCIFPIGGMQKREVREYALKNSLPSATRKDSQGICFLGNFSFRDFVSHHCGKKNGKYIEYESGKILGEHQGYWFYTIGQRQGIGLSGGPWYVVSKEIEKNIVFLSRNYFSQEKERRVVKACDINWLCPKETVMLMQSQGITWCVKLRHGPKMDYANVSFDFVQNNAKIILSTNDQGISPGQFIVFYTEEGWCIAAGVIC